MKGILRVAIVALVAATVLSAPGGSRVGAQTATPQAAPQATAQPSATGLPQIPDPVAVTLDASTTAFLALDFQQASCNASRPTCVASLPTVASALAAARAANVSVFYSTTPGNTTLPEVAPMPSDTVVPTFGADKFFKTNLDDLLKAAGITTVVITGTASNSAVLYTALEAAVRGYTVVVAEDGISASTDFPTFYAEWQLLNGPGTANPQNTPLQPKAATLSRTDLITYE
jgi:nicotinamidase-related amidase